jgi:hypothetical protein
VAPADFSVMSDMWVSFGFVTALSLILSSARRAPTLSVSTRHKPSDLWALADVLTSYMGFIVYGSPIFFNGERDREDRSRSIVGDMIPWFRKAPKWRFLLYSYGKFLEGFFAI